MASKRSTLITIASKVILFVAGGVIGVLCKKVLDERILDSESWTLLLIMVLLALISVMVAALVALTEELRRNVGIKISYFDRDRYERATLFAEARKVIDAAQESISVLNSFLVETPEEKAEEVGLPESVKKQRRESLKQRDKYYDALVDRALSKNILYERILQLKKGQTVKDLAKDQGYLSHFRRILEEKKKHPRSRLTLLKAPANRLSTFVLVDDENLLWQINEPLESGEMQMHGIFIIHDPRHEITQHFRVFIEQVKGNSFGAVESGDLQ